jgi:hypothetical protein
MDLNDDTVRQRIDELLVPIDLQLYQCDKESALMLACGMFQRSIEILDAQLGKELRQKIIKDFL